jgi:16S rRNA (adenine1518-N6/adenine1519-N6)-dimethyltransferase
MKHQARKRFGQHFLHDPQVIGRIIDAINPNPGDVLIEIGPGLGAITLPLIQMGVRVIALDIDRDVLRILSEQQIPGDQLRLIEADALRFDFKSLSNELGQPLRVIGNLPYNISTPLLFHLLESAASISDMHFMLQKEVIDRMVAGPGSKTYGRLSVMVQAQARAESLFDVGPGAFKPPPKVVSSIVRVIPTIDTAIAVLDQALFGTIVTGAFSQRRKTCRNALRPWLNDEDFIALNLDPTRRPETLGVSEFAQIAHFAASKSTFA